MTLPKYKCHKEVYAVKIESIEYNTDDYRDISKPYVITPCDKSIKPFRLSYEFVQKHHPMIGGYYVLYEDGYESWSPAKAFEEGYTRIA